ncbi:MAG: M48 family metallopeptidase [Flavobacteriaceae bacterium]|jgi:putative metalloprotease|nr:M48 family metallopeptidase [Flavobacteriaceae bacterium]
MKKTLLSFSLACFVIAGFNAQILNKIKNAKVDKDKVDAAAGVVKSFTVTDAEVADAAARSVKWMDENNPVCTTDDKDKQKKAYADRLEKIFGPYKNYDGLNLNYKVYYVTDVNAFACPDGSIRVFSSLMDLMTDDEILGVIGHEIGHVKLEHSKKAYKQALLAEGASKFAGSTGTVAELLDSDIGGLAVELTGAQFSQAQESAADDYSYEFFVANGKDPQALADAFKKLAGDSGGNESFMSKMLSSHPDSAKRAKKIEERIKKDAKKK